MPLRSTLKPILKRGCLVAAANWQVTLVQSTADSLFKLLLAVPLVGGVFLVALAVGAEPGSLFGLTGSEFLTTILGALLSHPVALAMFVLSLGTMAVGGSLFVFLIKGGTIGVLVAGDQAAGSIEEPPLQFERVARAARFSIEIFVDRAQTLFPRYAKLGLALMVVYMVTGVVYFGGVVMSRTAGAASSSLRHSRSHSSAGSPWSTSCICWCRLSSRRRIAVSGPAPVGRSRSSDTNGRWSVACSSWC